MNTFSTYHPLVNFIYFTSVIAITMFSMHPIFLALTLVCSCVYSCVLGGARMMLRNIKLCIPIVVIMMILNPLFTQRGETILFYLNDAAVTQEAVVYGMAAAVLFSSMIIWFFCFGEIMSTDKFIYLFGRVAPAIALVLSICFRFIPLLKRRFQEICAGQKYLGRTFPKKSILKKVRLFGKQLSILVAWSLEMSIETSDSMEARGYGLKGRTSYSIFRFDRRDAKALTGILILAGIVIFGCIQGENKILYYPRIVFGEIRLFSIFIYAAYLLLLTLPVFIDVQGEMKWKQLNLEM